jgi:hypothetical protein
MSCRRVVRPILFSEALISQLYCDTIVYPFIVQLKEDETDKAYFQQDGAMAYTAQYVYGTLGRRVCRQNHF